MISGSIAYIKGPSLNILVCEIYESLHQEGELTLVSHLKTLVLGFIFVNPLFQRRMIITSCEGCFWSSPRGLDILFYFIVLHQSIKDLFHFSPYSLSTSLCQQLIIGWWRLISFSLVELNEQYNLRSSVSILVYKKLNKQYNLADYFFYDMSPALVSKKWKGA